MRFASLGSGSRGNATVVVEGNTCILVDCGFSVTTVKKRLARLGLSIHDLTAIVVTHEHSDHLGGVARLARGYDIPVWMSPGTHVAWNDPDVPKLNLINTHEPFAIDGIELHPYPVPHDAREPCQYLLSNGDVRLAVLSDAGHVTPFMRSQLDGCDALLVETNYDPDMLAGGPYPMHLKRRVGGQLGHLSNAQTQALLATLDSHRLRHVVIGHISEKNNTPELAREAAASGLDCEPQWVGVADQRTGFDWRSI